MLGWWRSLVARARRAIAGPFAFTIDVHAPAQGDSLLRGFGCQGQRLFHANQLARVQLRRLRRFAHFVERLVELALDILQSRTEGLFASRRFRRLGLARWARRLRRGGGAERRELVVRERF